MTHRSAFAEKGHLILPDILTPQECAAICDAVDAWASMHPAPARGGVHAIRALLEQVPGLDRLVFQPRLLALVHEFAEPGSFLTKSIYFDKPPGSNWFVAWHQDISITVAGRHDCPHYGQWTHKQGITGVVPPLHILTHTLTLRLHLDDTDEDNGALHVVEGSHREGILRKEQQGWSPTRERICRVPAGGVMLMRPLTLHASRRAQRGGRRRVIHLEFCNQPLAPPLQWGERHEIASLGG